MIESIKWLQAIGRFNEIQNQKLSSMVIVYGENGQGKTTLTSVIRSMATANPSIVQARHRQQASRAPKVVFGLSGNRTSVFDESQWRNPFSKVHIYDDEFVNSNVSSGLEVGSEHRKSLHEVVLGSDGVELDKEHREAKRKIEDINKHISEVKGKIRNPDLEGLEIDEFLALDSISDVDQNITNIDIRLHSLRDKEKIAARPALIRLSSIPEVDLDRLSKALMLGIEGLDEATIAAVKSRVDQLGDRGELWLSDGYDFSITLDQCAFCGAGIGENSYIDLYKLYFGQNYKALADDIEGWKRDVSSVFSNHILDRIVQEAHKNDSIPSMWSDLLPNAEPPELRISEFQLEFRQLKQSIIRLLNKKISNPAESIPAPRQLIIDFTRLKDAICDYNYSVDALNNQIDCVKREISSFNNDELVARIARLTATKNRWSEPLSGICTDLLTAMERKNALNAEKDSAQQNLDEYRRKTFSEYQGLVNEHLDKCGAGWRIAGMEHRNTSGGSSTRYEFGIEDSDIVIAVNSVADDRPSFKTSLSAGDRSALALSHFFASLRREDLSDAVVVIDDPVTSLDIRRQRATIKEIVAISQRSAQVIVLSHEREFLIRLWKALGRNEVEPMCLEVGSETPSSSTIMVWDVNDAALTEEQRALMRIEEYMERPQRAHSREIAKDLRICVESHFHQLFPGKFPSSKPFANSLAAIRDAGSLTSEAHDNVRSLCDYSNEYHHPDSDDPDSGEVLSMAKKALSLLRKF